MLAHPLSSELRALVRAVRKAACLPLEPIDFVDDYAAQHTADEINPRELISGKDLIERGLAPDHASRSYSTRFAMPSSTARLRRARKHSSDSNNSRLSRRARPTCVANTSKGSYR